MQRFSAHRRPRRGRRLIYRSDDRLLSVRIDASPRLVAGVPSVLISHLPPIIESAVPGAPLFDLSADEDRVLCVERDPLTPIRRLAVVVNWFADLKRKVPIPN